MKKIIQLVLTFLFLLFMTTEVTGAATYRLQRVTSVEAGSMYVFEQGGRVMIHSISSNALQTTNTFSTFGLNGSENYVWNVSSATGGFYIYKNSSNYLNNPSSTNLALSGTKGVWTFSFQSDGTAIIGNNNTGGSFLGYTSATSTAYKCYNAAGEMGYEPHSIVVYKLVEETKASAGMHFDETFLKVTKGAAFDALTVTKAKGFDGTVTYTSSNSSVATVDAATGHVTIVGVGRTLITASSAATASYDAGEATYTLLVMGGYGTSSSPYCISDVMSGYMTWNSNVYIQGYIVGYYTSSSNLQPEAEANDFIALADVVDGVTSNDIALVELSTEVLKSSYGLMGHPELIGTRVIANGTIWPIRQKTSIHNVSSITTTDYPITITSYKYATYRTLATLDFSDTGISAYTAAVSGGNVVLSEIEDGIVPANHGVVLYSETAATYDIPVTTATASVNETGLNISDGSTATKENNTYVLGHKDGNVGFYRWIGAASLSAGRVYLTPSQGARDFLTFVFSEEPSGIEAPHADQSLTDGCWTDLSGRRLSGKPKTKGIYIVDGKKVLVK